MLLFIAVIATLNLCLGYLLGVHMSSTYGCTRQQAPGGGILDQPHSALGDPPLSDLDDFAPYSPDELHSHCGDAVAELSLPAPRQNALAHELTAELPESLDLDEFDLTADAQPAAPMEPVANSSRAAEVELDTEYGSPPNVASPASTLAPVPTAQAPEHDTTHDINLDDYMTGLAAFESQISQVDQQLRHAADPAAVDRCATEMTTASNRYVVQARQACEHLNGEEVKSSLMADEKLQLQQSINDQTRMVMDHSENIRVIDVQGDMGGARDSLLELSTDLAEAAAQLRSDLVDIIARAAKSHETLAVDQPAAATDALATVG